jgi:hypothetical protein
MGGTFVLMSMTGISRRVVAEPVVVPKHLQEPKREPVQPPQPVART